MNRRDPFATTADLLIGRARKEYRVVSIQSTAVGKSEKRKRAIASGDFTEQQANLSTDPLRLVRKKALAELLGVNVYTIDGWRRRGLIPAPVVLSPQIVAWRRVDIDKWLDARQLQPAQTRRGRR